MKFRIFLLALILGVAIGALFYWFAKKHAEENGKIVLYGNVDIRQADLGFRVYGRVTKLLVDEGDEVNPGQLIAELDAIPYHEKVMEAAARVKSIEKRLENATLIYNRREKLIGMGAVSEENFSDALANQEELVAELEQARAALALARTNYGDTKMYAPSLGTILTRIREPGSVVNVGEPVFVLSILSPVWVRAYLSEPQLGLVRPGKRAEVYTDTPGGKVYEGRVGFISSVAEFTPKTVQTTSLRTDLVYRIRVIVDNPDYVLKQGMPVTVKLIR